LIDKNPFFPAPVPRRDQVYWADRRQLRERLSIFLQSKPEKGTEILVILGDYGSGKTHTLIFADMVCREKQIPHVFISDPGSSFLDLMTRIVNAIEFEEILADCHALLDRDKERILKELEKEKISRLIKIEGLSTERMLRYIFPSIDVNYALILGQAYNNRNIDLCRSWLLAKQMTSTELGRLNVSSSISTDDYAVKILADTIRLITRNRQQLVILLDELEDIGHMSKAGALSFAKSMRRLIDENIPGLKLILSCTRDGFDQFANGTGTFQGKRYPALTDRLRPLVHLSDLTQEETIEFIQDFVSLVYKGPLKEVLTAKTLNSIHKKSNGSPRAIIRLCYDLFQRAISDEKFPIEM